MTASLFSESDSASPTAALPSLESLTSSTDPKQAQQANAHLANSDDESVSSTGSAASEYIAPLSGHAPDASIDGTSVGAGEGGIRPESKEEVTEQDKAVSRLSLPDTGLVICCDYDRLVALGVAAR